MRKKTLALKKVIALLLALVVSVQWLPFISYAEEQNNATDENAGSLDENILPAAEEIPGEKPQKYRIILSYILDGEGHITAIESTEQIVEYGTKVHFTLPDSVTDYALPAIKGLTPVIVSDDLDNKDKEISAAKIDAAKKLSEMIKNNTSMDIEVENWAAFIEACETLGWIDKSNSETNLISIPVTFTKEGPTHFKVKYLFQNADDPTEYLEDNLVSEKEGEVLNTITVSLVTLDEKLSKENRFVKEFPGFTISPESSKTAYATKVEADDSGVIELKYDRNKYRVHFSMSEGKSIDPIEVMYGANIANELIANNINPERKGYVFNDWTRLVPKFDAEGKPVVDEHGRQVYEEAVITGFDKMPSEDIVLNANWLDGKADVHYQIWVEDTEDSNLYRPYADSEDVIKPADTGKTLSTLYADLSTVVTDSDNPSNKNFTKAEQYFKESIVTSEDSKEYAYFKYNAAKTQELNNGNELIKGQGTIVNICFDRREFTVVFHLGFYSGGHQIITGGRDSELRNVDENADYKQWKKHYSTPYWNVYDVKMENPLYVNDNTQPEFIHTEMNNSNDPSQKPYKIKAKYGENISDKWPSKIVYTGKDKWNYSFLHWCSSFGCGLNNDLNKPEEHISSLYGIMDKNLIIKDGNGYPLEYPNHFVAMFKTNQTILSSVHSVTYHYMVKDAGNSTGTSKTFSSIKGNNWNNKKEEVYTPVGGKEPSGDSKWIEFKSDMLNIVKDDTHIHEPPSLLDRSCVYALTTGNKTNVYYFYDYTFYNMNFKYTLPTDTSSREKVIPFTMMNADPMSEMYKEENLNPGQTEDTYVKKKFDPLKHGNLADKTEKDLGYKIERWGPGEAGEIKWYKDPSYKLPVESFSNIPSKDTVVYARWIPLPVTLTLEIPHGAFPENQLTKLQDDLRQEPEFAEVTVEATSYDINADNVITISGLPKNKDIGVILDAFLDKGPVEGVQLFSHWEKFDKGKNEWRRYIYDNKTDMVADLKLKAVWKPDMTGKYQVEYVTRKKPDTWSESLGTIEDPKDPSKTLYRIREPIAVSGVEVGKEHTVKVMPVPSYPNYIPEVREQKVTIQREYTKNKMYFVFDKSAQNLIYTVHYVLIEKDEVDYGSGPLPADKNKLVADGGIKLAEDKVVNKYYGENDSVMIREVSKAVSGYHVRYRTEKELFLTNNPDQNHIYFYYDKNKIDPDAEIPGYKNYTINFFLKTDAGYNQVPDLVVTKQAYPKHVIVGTDVARNPDSYVEPTDLPRFTGYIYDDENNVKNNILHISDNEALNIINIYMKKSVNRITYKICADEFSNPLEEPGWLHWNSGVETILKDNTVSCTWLEDVTFGRSANAPTGKPDHPAYVFKGWKKQGDTNLTKVYTNEDLALQPWFTNVTDKEVILTAVMEKREINVFYTCYPKGGIWNDENTKYKPILDETGFEIGHYEIRDGNPIQKPAKDPTFKVPVAGSGERPRKFEGWATHHPDYPGCIVPADGTIAKGFEYEFGKPVLPTTHIERIYAIWNPQPYSFLINKIDMHSYGKIKNATFKLTRLVKGADGQPEKDAAGAYKKDPNFTTMESVTDKNGHASFMYLTEGYYLLEEIPAEGYIGIEPLIICAPDYPERPHTHGSIESTGPHIYEGQTDKITTSIDNTNIRRLTININNERRYQVAMILPKEVTYSYVGDDLIWDPVSLKYVIRAGGNKAHWDCPELKFTATNISPGKESIKAIAELKYEPGINQNLYGDTEFTATPYSKNGNAGTTVDAKYGHSASGAITSRYLENTLTEENPRIDYSMKLTDTRYLSTENEGTQKIGVVTVNFTPDAVVIPENSGTQIKIK